MEKKHWNGQTYYSKTATNGAICDVGEITTVFVYDKEYHEDSSSTCRIYCTDGYAVRMVKAERFDKSRLKEIAEKYLNTKY